MVFYGIYDRPWTGDNEEQDWPSQAELDELAAEWTEEEREAEQARLMDLCYGRLPAHLRQPSPSPDHEEEAA